MIMIDRNKIKNGGVYLVDLTNEISPEIVGQHYCYAFKSKIDKNLYLCFIMTSKPKRSKEKYTFSVPENPNGIIMLKHTKLISSNRFLNTLKDNNKNNIVLSPNSIKRIFKEYNDYLLDIQNSAIKSAQQREKQISYDNMLLEVKEKIIKTNINESINLIDNVNYANGTLTIPKIDVSKIGIFEYDYIITDIYGQTKKKTIILEVINSTETKEEKQLQEV